MGTKALVFLDPTKRNTWQSHAIDAWYVGPAKQHYRNYRFFIPETKGYRITSSAKFYPAHCKLPAIEPGDTIRLAAQDLIAAIQKYTNGPINLNPRYTEALRQLSTIFNEAARADESLQENDQAQRVNQQLQRVKTQTQRVVKPSSSHDATSPKTLASQPRIHQRVTRANKPLETIHEETPRALQRIRTCCDQTKPAAPVMQRPCRTVAQYNQRTETVSDATPEKFQPIPQVTPNYITQDDEEHLANLLFNVALPQIIQTQQMDQTDYLLQQANHMHTKLYNASLPKTQIVSTKTPLGINSQALIHLMGAHLENPYHFNFIPNKFAGNAAFYTDECCFEHVANGVVHPITKETITKY